MATKPEAAPTAAKKPRGPRKKAAAAGATPEVSVTPDAGVLKFKDLVAAVTQSSGVNRKDVKEMVEATLKVMGDALARGQNLHLPPLGKAKVGRQKGLAGDEGKLIVIKLRRGGKKKAGKKDVSEGVAATEE